MRRLPRKATAAGFAVVIGAAVCVLAMASVDGAAAPAAPSATAAAPRLFTTVVRRDVPVEGGVGEISCPTKTVRGGPSWVAVGGGVLGRDSYALGGSYPSIAVNKRRGWAAFLTPMPSFLPIGGTRFQELVTDDANRGGPWVHRHHILLPSSLLIKAPWPKVYSSLRMYVVCASIVPGGSPFRMVTSVSRRDVPADGDTAQVGCINAVAGGVVAGTGYAVGGSYAAFNSKGRLSGWSGRLTELPRFTFMGGTRFQRVLTDVGNRASYWSHRHHVLLPSPLVMAGRYTGYSSVRMSVVCAGITPATGLYRLNTTVVSRDVPVDSGAGQIFCPSGTSALGGGVAGRAGYAVGGSYPVRDQNGQAIGWAGSLTELPRTTLLGNGGLERQRIETKPANQGSYWQHVHHIILPPALLEGRIPRGYSSVRLHVVCASLGTTTTPLGGGPPKKAPPPPPAPPAPTTTTAPPPPPPPPPPTTTTTTTTAALPDLVIRKLFLDMSNLTWNIVIRNDGDADAPATKTGFTQPKGSDERRIDTPPIEAGDSVTVTAECPYGSIGEAKARADAGDKVDEKDEDNNGESAKGGLQGDDGEFRCRYP